MPSRRKSREFILQVLFSSDAQEKDPSIILAQFKSHFQTIEDSPIKLHRIDLDFVDSVVTSLSLERAPIDRLIQKISKNWKLYRMNSVDRNIIRMVIAEARAFPETPMRVLINEAIEIAKIYGADNSPSFVNGVLDKLNSFGANLYTTRDLSELTQSLNKVD